MAKWYGYIEREAKLMDYTGSNEENGMKNYWLLCNDKMNVGDKCPRSYLVSSFRW